MPETAIARCLKTMLTGDAGQAAASRQSGPVPEQAFCVDCAWHLTENLYREPTHHCGHPRFAFTDTVDPVTGKTKGTRLNPSKHPFCENMRDTGGCGPQGKLWKPKQDAGSAADAA